MLNHGKINCKMIKMNLEGQDVSNNFHELNILVPKSLHKLDMSQIL